LIHFYKRVDIVSLGHQVCISRMSTPAALSKLKVGELREKLEAGGLSTEGTKPVLLARLRESLGGSVVKTPDVPVTTLTPGGRRSKRLSESHETPIKRGRLAEVSEASSEAAVRPDTPLKRGRVSEVSEGARPASPLRRGRVSDTSRPLTPVRRSRRLSGDFPDTPVLSAAAPEAAVETIAEVNEDEEQEEEKKNVKVIYASDRNLKDKDVKKVEDKQSEIEQKQETEEKKVKVIYASDRNLKDKDVKKVEDKQSEIEQKLDLVKNIIADAKEEIRVEKKKEETKSTVEKGKENLPLPKLLEQVFSSKQIPRQKPKSGRFWKGERSQFRQIKKDKGQRLTFEQRVKMKEEKQRNQELAETLNQRKKQAKEDQRKRMEENKEKRLENERRTEQYQIIKNPAKLKRMKKKQLRMLEKRDILAAKK